MFNGLACSNVSFNYLIFFDIMNIIIHVAVVHHLGERLGR